MTRSPPCRDADSPDLGTDKGNAAHSLGATDSPITLTKFFNRIYTGRKLHLPRPLPKGRLIDLGDADASDDDCDNSDSDDGGKEQQQFGLIVDQESLLPAGKEKEEARGSPRRRPLGS